MKYYLECTDIEDLMINKGYSYTKACETLGYAPSTLRYYFKDYLKNKEDIDTNEVEHSTIPFISTSNNISFVWDDEIHNISKDNSRFDEIKRCLLSGNGNEAVRLSSLKNRIESYEFGDINVENGVFKYKNVEFHNSLVDKIIKEMDVGNIEFEKYVKFADRVLQNPSFRVRNRIYDFIRASDIEITENGFFIAFKAVTREYLDMHTKTITNRPGDLVEMDRGMVDDDDNVTCSKGLHVCSASYIPNFAASDSRIMQCIVDPKDVVSVPIDYNDAKMRVCRYLVEEDITEEFYEKYMNLFK